MQKFEDQFESQQASRIEASSFASEEREHELNQLINLEIELYLANGSLFRRAIKHSYSYEDRWQMYSEMRALNFYMTNFIDKHDSSDAVSSTAASIDRESVASAETEKEENRSQKEQIQSTKSHRQSNPSAQDSRVLNSGSKVIDTIPQDQFRTHMNYPPKLTTALTVTRLPNTDSGQESLYGDWKLGLFTEQSKLLIEPRFINIEGFNLKLNVTKCFSFKRSQASELVLLAPYPYEEDGMIFVLEDEFDKNQSVGDTKKKHFCQLALDFGSKLKCNYNLEKSFMLNEKIVPIKTAGQNGFEGTLYSTLTYTKEKEWQATIQLFKYTSSTWKDIVNSRVAIPSPTHKLPNSKFMASRKFANPLDQKREYLEVLFLVTKNKLVLISLKVEISMLDKLRKSITLVNLLEDDDEIIDFAFDSSTNCDTVEKFTKQRCNVVTIMYRDKNKKHYVVIIKVLTKRKEGSEDWEQKLQMVFKIDFVSPAFTEVKEVFLNSKIGFFLINGIRSERSDGLEGAPKTAPQLWLALFSLSQLQVAQLVDDFDLETSNLPILLGKNSDIALKLKVLEFKLVGNREILTDRILTSNVRLIDANFELFYFSLQQSSEVFEVFISHTPEHGLSALHRSFDVSQYSRETLARSESRNLPEEAYIKSMSVMKQPTKVHELREGHVFVTIGTILNVSNIVLFAIDHRKLLKERPLLDRP